MVILDVSVPFLGRFAVLDDFTIEDISLLPDTEPEIARLNRALADRVDSFGATPLAILESALAGAFCMPLDMLTVHEEANVSPTQPEPNFKQPKA